MKKILRPQIWKHPAAIFKREQETLSENKRRETNNKDFCEKYLLNMNFFDNSRANLLRL